jgi:hypothetical protein
MIYTYKVSMDIHFKLSDEIIKLIDNNEIEFKDGKITLYGTAKGISIGFGINKEGKMSINMTYQVKDKNGKFYNLG